MEERDATAGHGYLMALSGLLEDSIHPSRQPLMALVHSFRGTAVEVRERAPPSAEEALTELGLVVYDGDLAGAVKRFVSREQERRRALTDRLGEAELRDQSAARLANLMTLVSTVLVGLLLALGAVAMDLVEIDWMDPVQWDDEASSQVPAGTAGVRK